MGGDAHLPSATPIPHTVRTKDAQIHARSAHARTCGCRHVSTQKANGAHRLEDDARRALRVRAVLRPPACQGMITGPLLPVVHPQLPKSRPSSEQFGVWPQPPQLPSVQLGPSPVVV
jgi:hypothetical protein